MPSRPPALSQPRVDRAIEQPEPVVNNQDQEDNDGGCDGEQ